MKYDWKYYIDILLKRNNGNLKNSYNIIEKFDLLDDYKVEGRRDPSTPEYGFWITNGSVRGLLEYLDYNQTLNKSNIIEENIGMDNYDNVFSISKDKINIFKVKGDSLVKIVISLNNNKLEVNTEVYNNIASFFAIILETLKGKNEKTIENNLEYFDSDTKTMVERVRQGLMKYGNIKIYSVDFETISYMLKLANILPDATYHDDDIDYDKIEDIKNNLDDKINFNLKKLKKWKINGIY